MQFVKRRMAYFWPDIRCMHWTYIALPLLALLLAVVFCAFRMAMLSREVEELRRSLAEVQAGQEALEQSRDSGSQAVSPPEEDPVFLPLDIPLSTELQEHTYQLCRKYDIPFEVALSVMYHESRFQVDAVGYNANGTKDSGPMQINSINRKWLLDDHDLDIDEPEDNIEAALLILAAHMEEGGLEFALTAYNQGPSRARRLGGKSTYADRILNLDLENLAEF